MSYESFLATQAEDYFDDSGFEQFRDDWDADYDLYNKSEDFVRDVYRWYLDKGYIVHTPEELEEEYEEWLTYAWVER